MKAKKSSYYTIGVRFVDGHGSLTRVFTYRVRNGRKVYHGDLLVADSPRGPAIVAVVRIDTTPQDNEGFTYKFIEKKVAAL